MSPATEVLPKVGVSAPLVDEAAEAVAAVTILLVRSVEVMCSVNVDRPVDPKEAYETLWMTVTAGPVMVRVEV